MSITTPDTIPIPGTIRTTDSEQNERRLGYRDPVLSPSSQQPLLRKSRKSRQTVSASSVPLVTLPGRRRSYLPVVSSPLKQGHGSGKGGEGDGYELETLQNMKPNVPRRSLQVRVADSQASQPPKRQQLEMRGLENGNSMMNSVVSLQSVGRDFSRYPSRQPSSTTLLSTSPAPNARPIGVPVNGEGSNSSGNGFDSDDPERGFSPYIQRRGGPVQYPTIDEKEDDDSLHNPEPGDEEKPRLRDCSTHFNMRAFFTIVSFAIFVVGLFMLFIVWPILTYAHIGVSAPANVEQLSKITFPHLSAIRTSMVDPDTPKEYHTRDSVLGRGKLKLVFSDEFSKDNRNFYPGDDQFWTAADIWYGATGDLEWYDPDAITTNDGTLQITLKAVPNHGLNYMSGMLQSWNQLCFKGGVMEVSASLPGPGGVPGLWPGIWTLGNLARPGYTATSDGVWPYSYDECDAGITPNQSSSDGISYLPGQRLNKCTCEGEDHPNPGTGRGAPEIDALEGSASYEQRIGVVTQSSQIAPFDIWYQTDSDFIAIRDQSITQMNTWTGGPFQQAISGVTMLNNDWYDGKAYQKYAFEYVPGEGDGTIAWFVGDEETFRMTGNTHGPNGNVGQRDVSKEPMSIVFNLGISNSWAWIDWLSLQNALTVGTVMRIDYVRIYQEEGKELITCDPPGYPTTKYISKHPIPYQNPNLTQWSETGYEWPKNTLMDECSA